MDDTVPAITRKRGRPKGGKARGQNTKSRRLRVAKKAIECNKTIAEVVAEPTENYDELGLPDQFHHVNTVVAPEVETPIIEVETTNIEDDESDSEIENGDEDWEDVDDGEPVDGFVEFVEERNEPLFQNDIIQRLAIGFMFYKKFGAPENHQEWRLQKIRPQIRKAFDLPPGARIDHILNDVVACKKAGVAYTGTRKIGPYTGKQPTLDTDSNEAQIVADCLESGFSLSLTQWMINQHRKESGEDSLTQSPIRHLMKRLKPSVRKVKKQAQGSTDPTSKWARARLGFNTQVLIRFGKLPEEEFEKIRQKNDGTLPAWFDPEKMKPLKPQQVAWWDETHRKCIIGGQRAGATHYVRFPRTPDGKLDLEAGKYDDTEVAWVNVKYEKEVRLCLGCGIKEEADGTTVGVCAKPFCYSGKLLVLLKDGGTTFEVYVNLFCYVGKLLVSLKDDRRNVAAEIARVKSLSHPGPWLAETREDGKVYEQDKTSRLKGVGAKSEEKLTMNGITTIAALRDMTPEKSKEISDAAREVRISESQLAKFKDLAKDAEPGDPPQKIDYRKFDNPYKERYGEEEWEEKIRATSQMSPYVCVTKMIEHIVAESAKMFKGTKFEDSWVFYHDALSLMTAKETVQWMKEKGYHERWLLPVNGLHSDDPDLKAYLETIPGSGPENMPWDLSLNKDAHEDTNRHVVLTH